MSLLLFPANPLGTQLFDALTLRWLGTLAPVPMVAVTDALHKGMAKNIRNIKTIQLQ